MWIFCGCEHVSNNDRYIHGYSKSNKQKNVLIDIDRYFWKKKKKAIDQIDNIHFIAPSKWMFERAKQSDILKKSKISIINIPIDVDFWKLNPSKRGIVKYNHHSSINIAFGSSSASNNKGLKMFINSLNLLKESCYFNNIVINYIGRLDNNVVKKTPFIYNNYGFISSNNSLKDVYQNSHICVFPSRIESFGQMAAESSIAGACVIAYSETGISEFIKDGKNGLLFNVYSDKCLADTIRYAIDKLDRLNVLEYNKSNMNELLSMGYIGNEYYKLLSKICN